MAATDLGIMAGLNGQLGRLRGTTNAAPAGAPGFSPAVTTQLALRASNLGYPGSAPVFVTDRSGWPGQFGEFGVAMGMVDAAAPTVSTSGDAGSQTIPIGREARVVKVPQTDVALPLPESREITFLLSPDTLQQRGAAANHAANFRNDLRSKLGQAGAEGLDQLFASRAGRSAVHANQFMARIRDENDTRILTPEALNYYLLCRELDALKRAVAGGAATYVEYKMRLYGEHNIRSVLEGLHFDGVAWENQPYGDEAARVATGSGAGPTRKSVTTLVAGPYVTVRDYWRGRARAGDHLYIRYVRTRLAHDKVPSFNFAGDQRDHMTAANYPPQPAMSTFLNEYGRANQGAELVVCPLTVQFVAFSSRVPRRADWTTYTTYDGQTHYDGVMQYVGKVYESYPSRAGELGARRPSSAAAAAAAAGASGLEAAPDNAHIETSRYDVGNDNPPLLIVLQPSPAV